MAFLWPSKQSEAWKNPGKRSQNSVCRLYNSSYRELLGKAGTTTLLIQRFRLIALTVSKSLHGLNPPCLNNLFTPKSVPYEMRDSSLLEQSRCRTTQFGLRSISYIGAKLWNDLPNDFKETSDFKDFKRILHTWTGPDLDDPFRSYVWAPSDTLYKSDILSGILFVSHIESRFYTLAYMFIAVLPWANRSVGAGDSLDSIARLAHGRPVLWLGTFGCAGRVRVARRFARCPSTACSACPRSRGACALQPSRAVEEHRGVPSGVSRSRSGDGSCPASILSVCDYHLFALYIFAPIVVY